MQRQEGDAQGEKTIADELERYGLRLKAQQDKLETRRRGLEALVMLYEAARTSGLMTSLPIVKEEGDPRYPPQILTYFYFKHDRDNQGFVNRRLDVPHIYIHDFDYPDYMVSFSANATKRQPVTIRQSKPYGQEDQLALSIPYASMYELARLIESVPPTFTAGYEIRE